MIDKLQHWLDRDPDSTTRDELLALQAAGDRDELAGRFAGRLQFGTAGLRGLVGAGPMRMNRLVVRETTAGFATYLAGELADARQRGVVVTYDARPDSAQFAQDAASVFLGAGFNVYLTESAQPTPLGAFGVLHLGAAAGVVITASHNPPQYNGYKVYWENGAQIIPPHDSGIAARIERAAVDDLPWMTIDEALSAGQLRILGDEFVDEYCRTILAAFAADDDVSSIPIRIAYTALHGVGGQLARRLVRASGAGDIETVDSQQQPDGTFPTVAFPNPEEPGAMDAVIALAKSSDAMLAIANDPDADRLAVAARDSGGNYRPLSGDQIGVLLGDYLLRKPHDFTPIVCASMVSSRMLEAIARDADAVFVETLTGFKWLINSALQREDDATKLIFAYEEALGYACGQQVRDKDGLSALLVFMRMTGELAADGKSVLDQLELLYRRHGLFVTAQHSIATQPGQQSITERLREMSLTQIAGQTITATKDLQSRTCTHADGRVEQLDFHANDVLIYYLADQSRIIVRPSGTEPKTKCYYEIVDTIAPSAGFQDARENAERALHELVDSHRELLAECTGARLPP